MLESLYPPQFGETNEFTQLHAMTDYELRNPILIQGISTSQVDRYFKCIKYNHMLGRISPKCILILKCYLKYLCIQNSPGDQLNTTCISNAYILKVLKCNTWVVSILPSQAFR